MVFDEGYGKDLDIFDMQCLKGVKRLEIRDDCFAKVNRLVIDGLNELKSVIVGKRSFYTKNDMRKGMICAIRNCDGLNEIHVGSSSFFYYESFELKNLPSLKSIQLDDWAFYSCRRLVFDSMND